ncbi:MAG: isochorismatase family protein [Verrucomicrobiaceae bacterium]|nr:isochorismatase family protein [Verrucomicrobiaceae bacterium]
MFMKPTLLVTICVALVANACAYDLILRHRLESKGKFSLAEKRETWQPEETAIIVCDMWDAHHCLNATRRGGELAPRMNAVLKAAREQGSLIIHAPSSCVGFYKDHPARTRALAAPKVSNVPKGIEEWLNWIDEREENAQYPIDHSDGGEDDDPKEHADWAKELESKGLNPRAPWTRQTAGLTIDPEKDAITDEGVVTWNWLEQHKIKNVILLGVHTNMCVLGRPFGLRQMAKNGKNVVLMRDMTDTMYNPKMPPYVSHYRGTDLIIEHVEKFVCPTITSDQLLGGAPFHFKDDSRKDLVLLIGEKEYETKETLPAFAEKHLAKDFRIHTIHASPEKRNEFPGIEAVSEADLLGISIRRRSLPEAQLNLVRTYVSSGKPIFGIRTASHAFSLRGDPAPAGHALWERFDGAILGGHYTGHHGNKVATFAWAAESGNSHPILKGVTRNEYPTGGSLYQVLPLSRNTQVLLVGRAGDILPHEPVAWTHETQSGSKVFYTSLGHVKDFENSAFVTMLGNACRWLVK